MVTWDADVSPGLDERAAEDFRRTEPLQQRAHRPHKQRNDVGVPKGLTRKERLEWIRLSIRERNLISGRGCKAQAKAIEQRQEQPLAPRPPRWVPEGARFTKRSNTEQANA